MNKFDILLEIFYAIAGIVSISVSIYSLRDKNKENSITTAIFWTLLGIVFIFGKIIPPVFVGLILVLMGVLTALKKVKIIPLENSTEEFRKELIKESTAIIGTVPVYDAVGFYDKELKDISSKEFLDVARKHGEDGVDFITVHCGINRETANVFKRNKRTMNIV